MPLFSTSTGPGAAAELLWLQESQTPREELKAQPVHSFKVAKLELG